MTLVRKSSFQDLKLKQQAIPDLALTVSSKDQLLTTDRSGKLQREFRGLNKDGMNAWPHFSAKVV